ncbi:MAG TPA: hypothetical protein VN737_05265 [Bryobacteraceae bacterium]|nr:hypothetical protein [Bryobacteraceae bacterium]
MTGGELVSVPRLVVLDLIMERLFIAGMMVTGLRAETKEEFFGFCSDDIVGLHQRKQGVPDVGVYFRLRDGRVIDTFGRA